MKNKNSQNHLRFLFYTALAGSASLLLLVGLSAGSCPPIQAFWGWETGCESEKDTDGIHESANEEAPPVVGPQSSQESLPLVERTLQITIDAEDSGPSKTVQIAVATFPQWIEQYETMMGRDAERIDPNVIEEAIQNDEVHGLAIARSSRVLSTETDKKDVTRATTDTVAREGYLFSARSVSRAIANALMEGKSAVTIKAEYKKPTVTVVQEDGTEKVLELLATSYSDFADSTPGREHNVYKVFNEHLNNVLVPAGMTFSHVAMIDAPITLSKGWKEDLGLFGGGTALTPGAGICQSSTSVYRAALLAGLPIVEFRNHSLFVDHYEFYGIGLDATIFPGVHDFRFLNDTGHELVMQAHIEYPKITLNIFGVPDDRKVSLTGPYFVHSKNRPEGIRPLTNHQVGWLRTITYADGSQKLEPRISTYSKPLWNSLIKKYDGVDGAQLLVTK